MSNKCYDNLRILQIVLPALGTLYFTLADIWSLPYGEQVMATIGALTAFLGVLLKISSNQYWADVNNAPEEEDGGLG